MKDKKRYLNRGITLIALVVTILVLIIIASISIGVLTGDSGLIKQAQKGKNEAEISEEKEIIDISVVQAIDEDVIGNLEEQTLQKKLNNNAGEGKTEVIDSGETIVVRFIEKNRYYEIDKEGKTEGPKELVKDANAGDISKGGTLDGSEEKPFEINCIEDLVAFSIKTNEGNQFTNKYIILKRTLDFKSIFSYNDYTSKEYGDLNTDGTVEDLRTELTKTEEGCIGFTGIKNFQGTFDGKENWIKDIYINGSSAQALFITTNDNSGLFLKIKNLNLTGEIISSAWAAGICSGGANTISNCKNYANVTGVNMVGGIVNLSYLDTVITNCENYGTIKATADGYAYTGTGGIVGCLRSSGSSIIQDCTNHGSVSGKSNCAGIIGSLTSFVECQIINCTNRGECDSGILSLIHQGKANILNCNNLGKTKNSGIAGSIRYNEIIINNCYNAGISNYAIIAQKDPTGTINVTNSYYDINKAENIGATSEGITGMTESEIKNNETFVETLNNNIGENTEWRRWKIGEDGYPTFE